MLDLAPKGKDILTLRSGEGIRVYTVGNQVIDSLDITPEERDAACEGNAKRLLKLPQK